MAYPSPVVDPKPRTEKSRRDPPRIRNGIGSVVAAAAICIVAPLMLGLASSRSLDWVSILLPLAGVGIGGYAAGWIASGVFGQPGRDGWARAFVGSIPVALLGSTIVGMLVLVARFAPLGLSQLVAFQLFEAAWSVLLILFGAVAGGPFVLIWGWMSVYEALGFQEVSVAFCILTNLCELMFLSIPVHLLARWIRQRQAA